VAITGSAGAQRSRIMADPLLDRVQRGQIAEDNQAIAGALHDYQWDNTFRSTPPADVLRSRLNLGDVIDRAVGNKLRLQAQGDIKALNILQKTAEMDEWQRQAPLREEKLKREVESKGAHERFVQQKDAEAMGDLAGFLDSTAKITAKPGTPEYQQGLNAALQKHPRVIGTQVGADALKRLQQEHVDIAALTPPPGQRVARTEFDESGKAKAIFEPIPETPSVVRPDGLVPTGAKETSKGVEVTYGSPKADTSEIKSLEKERDLYTRELAKARVRRQRATGVQGLEVDADTDIQDYLQKRDAVETQLRSLRGGTPTAATEGSNATPVAAEPTATNPKTGQKVVLRNGKWQPL